MAPAPEMTQAVGEPGSTVMRPKPLVKGMMTVWMKKTMSMTNMNWMMLRDREPDAILTTFKYP